MTATVTIQNADNALINALKSLVKLSPSARIKVQKNPKDDFFSDENIRHLKEIKRLDEEGKLHFVEKSLDELKDMAK